MKHKHQEPSKEQHQERMVVRNKDTGCRHKEHDPPTNLPPGFYQHFCKFCSAITHFAVRGTSL